MRELRVDPRQLANAGDKAPESIDVAGQHVEEPRTIGGILGRDEHFGCRSDRRERIPELVRDVRRKRLQQPDVAVQARRQFLQRARQVADLVPPFDDVERARQVARAARRATRQRFAA